MANNSWTIPTRIDSMVTHFQLPPYAFLWATWQARDNAISANSLVNWLFSKEQLSGSAQRFLEIIRYRRVQDGVESSSCLPVGQNYSLSIENVLRTARCSSLTIWGLWGRSLEGYQQQFPGGQARPSGDFDAAALKVIRSNFPGIKQGHLVTLRPHPWRLSGAI